MDIDNIIIFVAVTIGIAQILNDFNKIYNMKDVKNYNMNDLDKYFSRVDEILEMESYSTHNIKTLRDCIAS